jgi:uncharacterized membrane protein YGL010W
MGTMTESAAEGEGAAPSARRIDGLLAHYGESHQNPTNSAIHCAAIPLIVFSLLGLLYALHPWVAYALVVLSIAYYVRLGSWTFLAAMVAASVGSLAILRAMGSWELPVSVAVFVAAWIAQFVGHRIEGKKPSFFEDLQYLLIGPLFVLAKLFNKLGVRY